MSDTMEVHKRTEQIFLAMGKREFMSASEALEMRMFMLYEFAQTIIKSAITELSLSDVKSIKIWMK